MENSSQFKPRLVIFFFVAQVFINWLYNLWVAALPGIIINSWFVVMPMLGYFYFTFALIATFYLYQRSNIGIMLAYGVLMFGAASNMISYNVIFKQDYLAEQLIIPLAAVNFCVLIYIGWNNSYFKGE